MSAVCCKQVWGNHPYHPNACGSAAKFEVDGKHYCGTHNPNKAKTKAQIEAEEHRKILAKKSKLEGAAPELFDALCTLMDECEIVSDDASAAWHKARAAIAKATGEAT